LSAGEKRPQPLGISGHVSVGINEEVQRMAAKEGYCVKCKDKKEMKEPEAITMKNGRPATKGTCPDCGTKIFKIGG
jgi:hypothetical protein